MRVKRVVAVVVLGSFTLGVTPAPAQPPKVRPKTYEIILDVAAAQPHTLRVLWTQQDIAAIETFDDDTRNVMAYALATGTRAIITTQHPITSARYTGWTGTPWLALGKTAEVFGVDQQGFHFNASHENPNQPDIDLSDDIIAIGVGLKTLGDTLMSKSPTPASKTIGVTLSAIGLLVTVFGLGMKLAISGRSGSVDDDNDDDAANGGSDPTDNGPTADAPGSAGGGTGPDGVSGGGGDGDSPGDPGEPG